ncbi:MAG: bifunctional DNA-formamidopyrimidine glycosylase/DNA-(apurinic or apyrimidinic site) lyase [Acidiferrobacteraceae bacterium]
MPELPEVETTRRGIDPFVSGRVIRELRVREHRLRFPIPRALPGLVQGVRIESVKRRAKYLLLESREGTLIIHLGMSGSLRVTEATAEPGPFDHADLVFHEGHCLRLRDPRRFGCLLWSTDAANHPLLRSLGPEPLERNGQAAHLYRMSRGRRRAIRDLLIDGHIVAGIGNIYANEALFDAGLDPRRAAGRISEARYARLGASLKATLEKAIRAGGTTLRDFRGGDGQPGYFQQALQVYGRRGLPCPRCGLPLRAQRLGARSVFFCHRCQS